MFKSIGQVAQYKPLYRCGMEELAARQGNLAPSGGVLFARNVDGDQKRQARQRILDLFGRDKWDRPLNMLTMPGVHWRFERMLLGVRHPGWMREKYPRQTHFTGVENDRAIYFAAAAQMPGLETPGALVKPVKRDQLTFAECAIKSRHASFFFANVDDMLLHDWKPAPYREQQMSGWDAAWLDYTGPMTTKRLAAIKQFYEKFVREVLIVTTLRARWDRQTTRAINEAGGHSEWLRRHLIGDVLHDVEYFDTSPMAQFAIQHSQRVTP